MTERRSILGIVFLTVFLDIVGFSILFPLFPSILEHYLALEGGDSAIGGLIRSLEELAGDDANAVHTLFGGILGSVYGLLQFVFATVWGGLSDRIGRRKTLLMTLVGTALGYVSWIFAGTFAVLVVSRVVCGIMAGNIATASAAVADTTSGKDRAKGMGIVGMAIGLGFIFGPAIGGFSAGWRIDEGTTGGLLSLNPFSGPAILSLGLALLNLLWVATRFPETLPEGRREADAEGRSLNPFARIKKINVPGVALTDLCYLVYLIAFAGVEFTLTFLVVERLEFNTKDIAWMFVFVGLTIAFVQGGLVRRLAPKLGEKRVAIAGMLLTAPGFVLIGQAETASLLYLGLGFMAVGSALIMPCLSSLVSRYAPAEHQGLAIGTLRSMGSLARATGPILGAGLYWRFGSASPYLAGAAALLLPILLASRLPPLPAHGMDPES